MPVLHSMQPSNQPTTLPSAMLSPRALPRPSRQDVRLGTFWPRGRARARVVNLPAKWKPCWSRRPARARPSGARVGPWIGAFHRLPRSTKPTALGKIRDCSPLSSAGRASTGKKKRLLTVSQRRAKRYAEPSFFLFQLGEPSTPQHFWS